MDDTFKELTPEEIKLAALQFMGQHLTGDLKELNRNIIGQNATLRGMTLDPAHVLNSVPGALSAPAVVNHVPIQQPMHTVVNAGINMQQPLTPIPVQQQSDPNQLEFNFESSPLSKQIFDLIDRMDRKLDKLISLIKND
jgi:hypothetical protein